jgi:hypothetical protein
MTELPPPCLGMGVQAVLNFLGNRLWRNERFDPKAG